MKRTSQAGFTLMELMIASAISASVAIALGSFSLVSARLAGRNLASNHGHSSIAIANQRLLRDVQASGSSIQLMNFDGTTFTDVTASASADQDPMTGQTLSVRANSFRYWRIGGGPYQMTASTIPTTVNLTFNFGPPVNSKLPYTPSVNDKVWFPLLDREFKITAVTTTPSAISPSGTITIHDPSGIGYTIDTTSPNVTTAYFFHQVAYHVDTSTNKLIFEENYPTVATGTHIIVVHDMITSPKPFSVLFTSPTAPSSDQLTLRVSLEAYDLNYSKPQFPNGSTTMQTCISVRNQPAFVSLAQTPL